MIKIHTLLLLIILLVTYSEEVHRYPHQDAYPNIIHIFNLGTTLMPISG